MQRVPHQVFPALLTIFTLFSCQNDSNPAPEVKAPGPPKPDTIRIDPVPAEGAVTFVVTEGIINWLGKRTIGNLHTGTIKVEKGELLVSQNRLIGGTVILDMTSISANNLKDAGAKADLESHLKDSDFFAVKKYPTGVFKIDEVLPSNMPDFNWVISGSLTLKDKTNRVNIPVKLDITDTELEAKSANFVINRTQWGINFQSGLLGTAKDKLIEDIVPLALTLSAKKKQK